MGLTEEQQQVLQFQKQNLIVSASAGSGKTFILIKYITDLILTKKVPLSRFLVVTFTKAAANEMKERLLKSFLGAKRSDFLYEQIDEISSCDIRTIDSFCEKVIKQYISKTQLDENFVLIDEKQNLALKYKAFDRAIEQFSQDFPAEFAEIFLSFKQNRKNIFDCLCKIKDFFDCQQDEEYFIEYYLNNAEKIFNKACSYLNQQLKDDFISLSEELFYFNSEDKDLQNYFQHIHSILASPLNEDFISNVNYLSQIEINRFPSKRGESEAKTILKSVAGKLKKIISTCKKYDFSSVMLKKQQMGVLSNAILKLEKIFLSNYEKIKKDRDFIDFADAEKIAYSLLQDNEILQNLQNSYDYIFVDEYQDTNKLQESIIKPIAQKGMFVAVGDLKQGIYGFRNASMEIMLQDIQNFSNDKDSESLFLKSNFRSDKNILDFVNFIFEKVMTKDSTGVDYLKTSMLRGEQEFLAGKEKPVQIYIAKKRENEETPSKDVYSVEEDELRLDSDNNEAAIIVKKVKEFLNSEIYDLSLKSMRRAEPKDIAILFRKRSQIMNQCYQKLLQLGINAVTDSKEKLFDSITIQIICNLLKLTLSKDDDIALASVMLSPFGKFEMTELAQISFTENMNTFAQKVEALKEKDAKVRDFYEYLEDFKFRCGLKGVVESLREDVAKVNLFEKLSKNIDEKIEKINLDNFYKFIYTNDAEFNVPFIIESFEKLSINNNIVSQSNNAVSLTTIHATKGLEYPIVILAGCGDNFEKNNTDSFAISKEFGLGTNVFDNISLTKSPTPVLNAIKLQNKKRSWIDEIMIFYVALTRAKNHLVLCGELDEIDYKQNLEDCSSYFDLLFYVLGNGAIDRIENDNKFSNGLFELKVVQEEKIDEQIEKAIEKKTDFDVEKIKSALNFNYNHINYELKNSVSMLNEQEVKDISFSKIGVEREAALKQGILIHLALQLIDFDKVKSINDIKEQISLYKELQEESLDLDILFKNILILKEFSQEGKTFKEKEFVMSVPIKEIKDNECEDRIIIQGIIDYFVIKKDEIVLVDYKYTNTTNSEELKQRYNKQIDLYSKALIKAFPEKKVSKYLLSLKYGKLIAF